MMCRLITPWRGSGLIAQPQPETYEPVPGANLPGQRMS